MIYLHISEVFDRTVGCFLSNFKWSIWRYIYQTKGLDQQKAKSPFEWSLFLMG